MKKLKKILVCLLFSLAVFACVNKDGMNFFDSPLYAVENPASDSKSGNSIVPDKEACEADLAIPSGMYAFDLKHVTTEKVIISIFNTTLNFISSIWQPPRFS